jgi:hypothetical protein
LSAIMRTAGEARFVVAQRRGGRPFAFHRLGGQTSRSTQPRFVHQHGVTAAIDRGGTFPSSERPCARDAPVVPRPATERRVPQPYSRCWWRHTSSSGNPAMPSEIQPVVLRGPTPRPFRRQQFPDDRPLSSLSPTRSPKAASKDSIESTDEYSVNLCPRNLAPKLPIASPCIAGTKR